MRRSLVLVGVLLFAALGVLGQAPTGVVPEGKPVLAIAPFVDESGAGLLGVESGLAQMLAERLQADGYRVIPSLALESWLVGQGIGERTEASWSQAATAMGADYLLLGTLEALRTSKITLRLGFISIEGVGATARMSLRVVVPAEGKEVARLTAEGSGQGEATASFRLFLSLPWDVCLGGLRTSKYTYLAGEPVIIGYRDPSPPGAFYLVIHPVGLPGPSWTSPVANSTAADPCLSWTWDQSFGGSPAAPGDYRVELYSTSLPGPLAWVDFHISPEPAGWAVELEVGTPEFSGTAWNQALSAALEGLVDQLNAWWENTG
ncbi:hypothetical protein DRJ54_03145 [Candidatus Acetothermia bacterium]|nr:MAG: hypothetical protein DRJ54_03145 [Candidatus Acetothermia bacterium]